MMKQKLIEQLKKDEGFSTSAYKDTEGFLTIGYGRLIDKQKGFGITKQEAEYLLENDVNKVLDDLARNIPFFYSLSEARQLALCNMCFQLGLSGLLKFKKMLAAMNSQDWQEAYNQAMDSLWATQTPQRAVRVATEILRG